MKLPAKIEMISGLGHRLVLPHAPIATSIDGVELSIAGIKERLLVSSWVIRRWAIRPPTSREEWVALFNIALKEFQYTDFEEVPVAVVKK